MLQRATPDDDVDALFQGYYEQLASLCEQIAAAVERYPTLELSDEWRELALAIYDAIGPVTCAACDRAPAVRVPDGDDPHCESCYDKRYTECPSCSRETRRDDLREVQTCAATRESPAEYEVGCRRCFPEGPDDDGDAAYQRRVEAVAAGEA